MKYTWEESDIVGGMRFKLPSGNSAMIVEDKAAAKFFIVYTGDGNYNWSGTAFDAPWWAKYLTLQNARPHGWGITSEVLLPHPPAPLIA